MGDACANYVKSFECALNKGVLGFHEVREYLHENGTFSDEVYDEINSMRMSEYFISLSTNNLLDGGGKNTEIASHLAFAALVYELSGKDMTSNEKERKARDMLGGSERDIARFLWKRTKCSCLNERYEQLKSEPKLGVCDGCWHRGKREQEHREKLEICTGCRMVQYCSRECQVADWSRHKGACKGSTVPASRVSTPLDKLRDEITAKKRFIASLPPSNGRSEEGLFKAKHIQILAQKEEEYQLMMETERIADVVREHEELHPPTNMVECSLCNESIRYTGQGEMEYYPCCGEGCCESCYESSLTVRKPCVCPICRVKFSKQKYEKKMRKRANEGHSWFQFAVARRYLTGEDGYPLDKKEALKWLELAAANRHPRAMCNLANMYRTGVDGVVEMSEPKATALMKEAADLGNPFAQSMYAVSCSGSDGDYQTTFMYATLAYSQGVSLSANDLGRIFRYKAGSLVTLVGNSKVLYTAKHYLEEAAGQGFSPAYYPLARTLSQLNEIQFKGMGSIPGHSSTPRVLYWARKAVASGFDKDGAKRLVAELECLGNSHCANCEKGAKYFSGKLNACGKCKAVWYCGRDCQVQHWKAGHKTDCIKEEK